MCVIHFRWGLRSDISAIHAINAASFEGDGWTPDDFLRALRQRNCISLVATGLDMTVMGYVVYELHRDHLHVLSLAVAPELRGRGVGSAIIAKMKYKVVSHRRESLRVPVVETNTPTLLFLRNRGLRAANFDRGAEVGTPGVIQMVYRPPAREWENYGGEPINRIRSYLPQTDEGTGTT